MRKRSSVLCSVFLVFFLFLLLCIGRIPDIFANAASTVNWTGISSVSGYDYIIDRDRMTSYTMSATDSRWQIMNNTEGNPSVMFNGRFNGHGEFQIPGTVTLRFSDCITAYDNGSYDLIVTLSDVYLSSSADYVYAPGIYTFPYSLSAIALERPNGRVGINMSVQYQVVKHGTNTPANGLLCMAFTDIDCPSVDNTFNYSSAGRCYIESVEILSGGQGQVWVEPDSLLNIQKNGDAFIATQVTGNSPSDPSPERAAISFLGNAAGTTIRWGGAACNTAITPDMDAMFQQYRVTPSKEGPGTISPSTVVTVNKGMNSRFTMTADANAHIESVTVDGKNVTVTNNKNMTYTFTNIQSDHTIHVKFVRDSYAVKTQVRWQNVDGSWTSYRTVDSKTVTHGSSYSYTWVRNAIQSEPENIYSEPSPKTVGTSSVTGAVTYSISVPRKQYTYTFNFNPPSGHSVSEIGNRQGNLSNKYAETQSGTVKNPTLTGYTFLGWNTKADGTGSAYANEKMLSNKTFYAVWKTNSYIVRYNGNGSQNPDHQTGEFTQNNVTSQSGMPDSTYQYDQTGSLRKNDFVRTGYTFAGWNTKADGSGTSYPDQYNKVLNWSDTDGTVITLYAQWKKNLGTETITVVSEETGNPVSGVTMKLYKKVNGSWEEVPGVGTLATNKKGQITVNNLHWFDYEWHGVTVPAGYEMMSDTDFRINYDRLSATNKVILYLKEVSITLDSQVSDIIRGENPPAFLYHINGTDAAGVDHEYEVMVQTKSSKDGSYTLSGLFAGRYTVTQTPVSRYVPGKAQNISHASVSGINASVDVLNYMSAEVLFPYTIQQYGGFGHTSNVENSI